MSSARLGTGALLIFGLAAAAHAQEPEPKPLARARIAPRSATVGQAVTLTVDVLVPTYFVGAPRFPPLDVRDAVVVFQDVGGQNFTEAIGGQTYAGQSRSYLIHPQRPGSYEIPPFAVSVRFAFAGGATAPTPVRVPGGGFSASIPEAARGA
jgi:hypothetical protein